MTDHPAGKGVRGRRGARETCRGEDRVTISEEEGWLTCGCNLVKSHGTFFSFLVNKFRTEQWPPGFDIGGFLQIAREKDAKAMQVEQAETIESSLGMIERLLDVLLLATESIYASLGGKAPPNQVYSSGAHRIFLDPQTQDVRSWAAPRLNTLRALGIERTLFGLCWPLMLITHTTCMESAE